MQNVGTNGFTNEMGAKAIRTLVKIYRGGGDDVSKEAIDTLLIRLNSKLIQNNKEQMSKEDLKNLINKNCDEKIVEIMGFNN